jgi:hypothetical protein
VDPNNWKNGSNTEPVILQEILKWFKEKIENIEGDITNILNRITILENRKVVTDVKYNAETNKLKIEYSVGDPSWI